MILTFRIVLRINYVLKPELAEKSARLTIYDTVALPNILFGRENWTTERKVKTKKIRRK